MKVLICYYSTYGNVYKMANLVAEGVSQVAGAEPVVRTVPGPQRPEEMDRQCTLVRRIGHLGAGS